MNSAARVVTDTRKYDSGLSRLMHGELHWLDVTNRVRFKLAVLMYRCLHGTAAPYLMDSCTLTASAVCQSVEVSLAALSTEQFQSSMLSCGGPVDLEVAARQSSWPKTES